MLSEIGKIIELCVRHPAGNTMHVSRCGLALTVTVINLQF